MPTNRKTGTLFMVVSAVGFFSTFALSSNWYNDTDFMYNVINNLRLQLFRIDYEYLVDVPTKVLLAAFATTFGLGVLFYTGVIGRSKE